MSFHTHNKWQAYAAYMTAAGGWRLDDQRVLVPREKKEARSTVKCGMQ
jgi:hypothetical protein